MGALSGGLDPESAVKLERKHHDHYWQKGWVVIEGVFRPDEADRVADAAVRIAEREQAGLRDKEFVDISEDGRVVTPRKLKDLFIKDPVFREFFVDPRLLRIVRMLLGEEPLLLGDQTFLKPPRYGSNKPYHQDNFYFRCHPADHVVTTWVALDDVSLSNGCLRYIDGSHRGGILPHDPIPGEPHNLVPPAELIDLGKESPAIVRKGGVVCHHSQTLHTSHRNESDRWRRGAAAHWVTGKVTCETDTLDRAHFKRPELMLSAS